MRQLIPSSPMSRRGRESEDNLATRAIRRKIEALRERTEREEGELTELQPRGLDFRALPDNELKEAEAAALELATCARKELARREAERCTARWKDTVSHFSKKTSAARVRAVEALAELWMRNTPHTKFWSEDKTTLTVVAKRGMLNLYVGRITAEGLLVTAKGETCNLTERGPSVWP